MYIESFRLPIESEEKIIKERMEENGGRYGYIDNIYPCGIFSKNELKEISFKVITIFYGGNGSGKSTLLNLISQKLELNRISPFNSGELFEKYVNECSYTLGYDDEGFKHRIPNGSRIITSDDIFDYMLTVRTNNNEITAGKENAKDDWLNLRFGETIKLGGMEDYEALRTQLLARNKNVTRRQFIKRTVGDEVKLFSNGETALNYFESKLKNGTLYCLDEPENSLSPKMQLRLSKVLYEMAKSCECQFIISTHSPFILSIPGAMIYNLDETPVNIAQWWELDNTKTYFEFFYKHRHLFT